MLELVIKNGQVVVGNSKIKMIFEINRLGQIYLKPFLNLFVKKTDNYQTLWKQNFLRE